MSEERFSTEDEPMSADDLAILQAFDAMELWQHTQISAASHLSGSEPEFSQEDMLVLFASEMDEDIGQMKHALSQLEQGDTLDETRFTTLRRVAHKIRGTAGAMECHAMASIARHIEEVVAQVTTDALLPLIGLNVLVQAVLALEVTLDELLTHGHESDAPLHALEHELAQFSLALEPSHTLQEPITTPLTPLSAEGAIQQDYPPLPPGISVEAQRFERLLRLSEQFAETRTPLENAQAQVDVALRELHTAQTRLQQLERMLTDLAQPPRTPRHSPHFPASSLVERMLKEAPDRDSTLYGRKLKRRPHLLKVDEKIVWDPLEVEHYSERDTAIAALREAIAQVTITHTHVQQAYAHLYEVTQRYIQRATDVHTQLHLLRLTPLRLLIPHLRRVLEKSASNILFEVTGEATEVDQDILDKLIVPLTTLLHTCIVAYEPSDEMPEREVQQRIWLHAHAFGNEVTLEIGFSMAIQGGALETVQPFMQQVRGTIELQRNTEGSVSFFLRFPRSQGTVRGLLVRVGDQQVVVPFSQVQYVSDEQHQKTDIVYHLHKLLDFPYEPAPLRRVTPLIVLPQGRSRLIASILVDEVISDVTVIVKPLPSYLQRPGIAGTVLDGKGHVLLLLDIPALLKHYTMVRRHTLPEDTSTVNVRRTQRMVLVADDSTLLRKSLTQTLKLAHYATSEARDGLEALDLLTRTPPDVFLLDMEMPNLNGYDLLSIIHIYPELSDVKIIMLTSRSTEKYKQRALELGAHAYLTKPCPQDVLLETIEGVLQ